METVFGETKTIFQWKRHFGHNEIAPIGHKCTKNLEPKTISIWSRNTNFGKSKGIMLQWQICLNLFLNLLYFISFIIRSLLFESRTIAFPSCICSLLCTLRDCSESERASESFFSCLLGYVCSLPCTFCDHGKSETTRKTWKRRLSE